MLPVIGTDPIRFSLQKSRIQRRAGNPRESTADCLSQSEQQQQQNQQNPPSITLYPITVEFDRLLRRQQQLKQHQQCCWSPIPLLPTTASAFTSTSVPSTLRASKLASSGRAASFNSSTPAGRSNGHHSSSKSCTTDPASLLGNVSSPPPVFILL
ncbi:hypothetical protein TYRP_018192 [Tyrophagus putrescentiae]|nr:hypothetical protein TYRP_018192 [Tyrophagus putrescentiae]